MVQFIIWKISNNWAALRKGEVKTGGRNIKKLRYADETMLLAESRNDLK